MRIYYFFLSTLCLFSIDLFAQNQDTTITIPKEAWKKYFQNAKDSNHSAIADHHAYHESVIATDRPDQTESPYLVPKGCFQLETGFMIEFDKTASAETKNITYNTSLWKYGISNHIEARLITEYVGFDFKDKELPSTNFNINGFAPVLLGTKIFICDENKLIPKTALIAHLGLPYLGEKLFRPNYLAPEFRFTFQNTISDRFSVGYNLGAEWDGVNPNATWIYTGTVAINLVTNLGMYLEAYGFMTEKANTWGGQMLHDHRLDGGFTYVIKNNLQFDISGGMGINEISPDYFLSCGLSLRLPK